MKHAIFLAILGTLNFFAFGQNSPSQLISVRSGAVEELQALSVLAGTPPKFTVYPITYGQANLWLHELEKLFTYADNQAALRQITTVRAKYKIQNFDLTERREGPDEIRVFIHPSTNFELYLHTNSDLVDWQYGWAQRKPLLGLFSEVVAGGRPGELSFQTSADFDFREDHGAIESAAARNNFSSLPEDATYLDYNFPHRMSAILSGPNFSIGLMREAMSFGTGSTGSLALGSSPDFYDGVRLQLWNDWFSWTALWINLDGFLTANELSSWPEPSPSSPITPSQIKNLVYHRLEVRPFDFLHFALTEGMMVGGESLELKYFLPIGLIHNFYPWNDLDGKMTSASSLLSLELNLSLAPGLSVYGQYAHNQVQTSFETSNYAGADSIPSAIAGLAGVNFSHELFDGIIDLNLEWAETNPWMYLRENKLISYFSRLRTNTNVAGASNIVDRSIGYDLGPDSRVFAIGARYRASSAWSVLFSGEYDIKGSQNFNTPYSTGQSSVALKTPTGVSENNLSLGLKPELCLLGKAGLFDVLWDNASFNIALDLKFLSIENYQHVLGNKESDFQTVFSFMFNFL